MTACADATSTDPAEPDPIAVLLAGATGPILRHLDGTGPDATVLDLACGTGEPAAAILAEHPGWRLVGVDTSEDALDAARRRVPGVRARFRVGSMSELDLPDGGVDAVVSRMGALMMGDTTATAREIARVLRPGGRVAVATWAEQAHNPFLALTADALRAVGAPEEVVPDLAHSFDPMAVPGVRDGWLREAGLARAGSERISWTADFPSFDSWWRYLTAGAPQQPGGPLAPGLARLDDDGRRRARAAMVERMADHRRDDGGYAIPATGQLVWGVR